MVLKVQHTAQVKQRNNPSVKDYVNCQFIALFKINNYGNKNTIFRNCTVVNNYANDFSSLN